MIDATEFVGRLAGAGLRTWCGVPCSFLIPLIDLVISRSDLRYVGSANEGDAVATAAGASLGGSPGVAIMQNSGLGNAVNPLTSLIAPFRIPILGIVTWRGEPGLGDQPQHELMGRMTPKLLDDLELAWELLPTDPSGLNAALDRALDHLRRNEPYVFLVRKGSIRPAVDAQAVDPQAADSSAAQAPTGRRATGPAMPAKTPGEKLPGRRDALELIVRHTPEDRCIVIATTGHTGRELLTVCDRPNHFYMVGSMGCAAPLSLGLALGRPEWRVVVVDGDGAVLMRMGAMATVGAYASASLTHIVLDNGCHASTGGQPTVSPGISFAGVAQACGYGLALQGDSLSVLESVLQPLDIGSPAGPRLAALRIEPRSPSRLPRLPMTPPALRRRLMDHLGPGS
ncbi:MAG: phosphonopyruvate decarboxylase [Acidobacteriota bacterium]